MKVKILLGIPLLLLFAILLYFIFPWGLIYIGGLLEPKPSRPEITHGEFPFRLEYEINGQRKLIQDTVICEYNGISWDEGSGKHRNWKQSLASGSTHIILLIDEDKEIFIHPGSAKYYMGDSDNKENDSTYPNAIYKTNDTVKLLSKDQLLKEYKIKMISWEPSPPIKNHFSK